MAKIDVDAEIKSVRNKIQTVTPTTTGAGYSHTFVKADGLYLVDENDVVTGPFVAISGYTEGARVYHSADVSITTGVLAELTFNSERYDTDSIHDTSTNATRLTAKTAGIYIIVGNVEFENHVEGQRILRIVHNATTTIGENRRGLVGYGTTNRSLDFIVTTIWNMALNDYVELVVFQDSGVSLDIKAEPARSPEFMMQRIG